MGTIKLPIMSKPEYISPTAYSIFSHCNMKYWLMYLYGERVSGPQTAAMAIGSIFDSIVKSQLARDLNWHNKDTKLSLENLLKSVNDKVLLDQLLPEGWKLFKFYQSCGAYQDLIDEGVLEVEIENYQIIRDSALKVGIPLFGKPDVKIKTPDPLITRIVDWKVNGFGSSYGQSPKPGYSKIYDLTGKGPGHKTNWLKLEDIDAKWADQLSIYDWIERIGNDGVIEFIDIPVGIEQIVIRPSGVRVASFRTIVSADYQRNLYSCLEQMWTYILNEILDEPSYDKNKCFAYNKKCEVADRCPAFHEVFKDETFRAIMGI